MNDIDIISKQTGIEDTVYIERVYIESKRSIADTIMKLMEYDYCKEPIEKEKTVFDDIREVVAEKEKLFIQVMKNKNPQMPPANVTILQE